jgi:LDH2 family malate/lactate/ureidoglycolate dehydrogenase
MKAAPLAEGFSEVLVPGEPEDRHQAERSTRGIPYAASEIKALQDEAKRAGIQPLVVSERPIEA